MDSRLVVLVILFICLWGHSALSAMEYQQKFRFNQSVPQEFLASKKFVISHYNWAPHSIYETVDVYFDTDDNKLIHDQLGLRLRRVKGKTEEIQYALQLKSEMSHAGESRVEIDEKQLGLQKVAGGKLTSILDSLASLSANEDLSSVEFKKLESLLKKWIYTQTDSYLAPFQELRHRGISIRDLKPVYLGKSFRRRFHVYVDRKEVRGSAARIAPSLRPRKELPLTFPHGETLIWLMEASLDTSMFYPFKISSKTGFKVEINELEIENKYQPRNQARGIMTPLEKRLFQRWSVEKELKSKFAQAHNRLTRGEK